MKIGKALRTQASSLYSATPIGAPMHPAPIGVADRTRKKNYWRTVPGHHCLLAEGDIGAQIYWRTEAPLRQYIGAPRPPCTPTLLVLERDKLKLKSKQTSIATVRKHLRTVASLPTSLTFHYPLPLKFNLKHPRSSNWMTCYQPCEEINFVSLFHSQKISIRGSFQLFLKIPSNFRCQTVT